MRHDIFLQRIGNKIKAARKAKKIPLRRMGLLCEIDYGHLSRIENGSQNAHILTLKAIADVLKIDVKELL